MASAIPAGRTATLRAKDLGPGVWGQYKDLRERLKREGLTPKEAKDRAYVELKIGERWHDWKQRRQQQELLGRGVALTPAEMKEVNPEYQRPSLTRAVEIGEEQMSHPEVMNWAMRWAAKVENGDAMPTHFPNYETLFWFQSAVRERREFENKVGKLKSPSGDEENLYLQDSQYQFSQIEKQLGEAVQEAGEELMELESGFVELIRAVGTEAAA